MNRDNFTKQTIDILAKRVGFICSNPQCKKHTIGPSEQVDKATLVGIAAHITAASPGGPRYDSSLNASERSHINNGIWLCSNCATLIDKDPEQFNIELLKEWKLKAEQEMSNAIKGELALNKPKTEQPFLEADLIWSSGSRSNMGYSYKNREKFGGNIIPAGGKPIIFWKIKWNYSFVLHNNSRFAAYNIRIEEASDIKFTSLTKLPKINNLPPYASLDLKAVSEYEIESDHTEADELLNQKIPSIIEGLELRILYDDENRKTHCTVVTVKDNDIMNKQACC